MKKETKFFICKHCKNIATLVYESGVPLVCCGEKMSQLVPNTTDAAVEKHVPVSQIDGGIMKVKVGSVEHPMTNEHYIEWIAVESDDSIQIKHLSPQDKPEAEFKADGGKKYTVYAYCNLHGLWKA